MHQSKYISAPISTKSISGKTVTLFAVESDNIDQETVDSFGEEWQKFNSFSSDEIEKIGDEYFDIVPKEIFNPNQTKALDLGCGTGRWSIYLSDKVKSIEAIDPSSAIFSAAQLCKDYQNINLSQASVDNIPFHDNYFDFVMSLGVLHHIPDTQKGLADMVAKLKPGGFALIYLYYALDNRSIIYKSIFRLSSVFRYLISKMPSLIKKGICDFIAVFVYLPFIFLANIIKVLFGAKAAEKIPLSYYIGKSLNVVRNDALDRFGTPLEKRFCKVEVEEMMKSAGLSNVVFSPNMPCWHAIGQKTESL